MIKVKVEITSTDELMELIHKLRDYDIEMEENIVYNPARYTIVREEERQKKILDILRDEGKMDSWRLFTKLKKKDKCMYKSCVRNILTLYRNGLVDFNIINKNHHYGTQYEVWLK